LLRRFRRMRGVMQGAPLVSLFSVDGPAQAARETGHGGRRGVLFPTAGHRRRWRSVPRGKGEGPTEWRRGGARRRQGLEAGDATEPLPAVPTLDHEALEDLDRLAYRAVIAVSTEQDHRSFPARCLVSDNCRRIARKKATHDLRRAPSLL